MISIYFSMVPPLLLVKSQAVYAFLQLGDFPLPGGVSGSHGSVLLERGRGF
jgi:hypothetical protein